MTPLHKLLTAAGLAAILLVPFTHNSLANDELFEPVNRGPQSRLSGTVTLVGDVPEARRIDLSADPFCAEQSPNATTEYFVVNDGKVANVLVYVTNETLRTSDSFLSFANSVVLERSKCRFEPRVLGIQVGQPLEIVNRDKTVHNTHPYPKVNLEWNMSQPAFTALTQAFERPEVFIPVGCNQHPSEKAFISVFNHPFFAVTDKRGNYKIEGLPPGSYKVVAMHEKLGEKSVELAVTGGTAQSVDFVYPATAVSKPR
jgi:plastocyanin